MSPISKPNIESSELSQKVKALAVKQVKQKNNDFVEEFYILKVFNSM